MTQAPTTLHHLAFDEDLLRNGRPLSAASLTDQQKIAVVLQGATLLYHLAQCELRLADGGWQSVRVDNTGRIAVPLPIAGPVEQLPQWSVRGLLHLAFRQDGEISGRGSARRAARELDTRWNQAFLPWSPRRMVAEIFQAAPFLWQPAFAEIRRSLVAVRDADDILFAGPGGPHRRFLSGQADRQEIEHRLSAPDAVDRWDGVDINDDPQTLCTQKRWRQAADVWRRRPPTDNDERMAFAECLCVLGRYSEAIQQTLRLRRNTAWILRLQCHLGLGEFPIALKVLRSLEKRRLRPDEILQIARFAVRLLGRRNKKDEARDWAARAFQGRRGRRKRFAALIAAEAAWESGDAAAMDRYLEIAKGAEQDPDAFVFWHQVQGLRAHLSGDGAGVVEHAEIILQTRRQDLQPSLAGAVWNELAVGRSMVDDLPGAEQACRNALWILAGHEGARPITLAIYNLAEVRLRRGKLAGVSEAVAQSLAENRRSANHGGLLHDYALWMRYDLSRGDYAAALARRKEALQVLFGEEKGKSYPLFDLLAARALGLSGQVEEAAKLLDGFNEQELLQLEPEERPAVWALAGKPEKAARFALGTPWSDFWSSHLTGTPPNEAHWDEVRRLEPYRAARSTLDCELARPGSAPADQIRRAVDHLRACGAGEAARWLEDRSAKPWHALSQYAETSTVDDEKVTRLFLQAGYSEIRLTWREEESVRVLIGGSGGEFSLRTPGEDGHFVLQTDRSDSTLEALLTLVARDYRPKRRPPRPLSSGDSTRIVGRSSVLKKALNRIDRLSQGDHSVLILGESGTGKELAAKRVHEQSQRSASPFIAINCAAISENLIQSELFGHVRNAFTGADRDRQGIFEAARGGTVFLDEIGDLPLSAQGKLLRVLQEREIRRLGDNLPRKVDVRVIAATHQNLEEMVAEKTFRQDLFYRLNVAIVQLPPLRDRGDDLFLLAEMILHRYASQVGEKYLSKGARNVLARHSWPGNIRELKNILEFAATMAEEDEIQVSDIEISQQEDGSDLPLDYHQMVLNYRKKLVREAMQQAEGKQADAARRLGLSRQALSYLVRQLKLK